MTSKEEVQSLMTEPFARLNITPVLAVIRHRFVCLAAIMMLCLSGALPGCASDALAADDAYIAGYAAAVLHQEFKAGKVMESLEKLVVSSAQVLRGGKIKEVPAAELVLGDIVYVEEGVSVPADLRTFSEKELSTNDFALTGGGVASGLPRCLACCG